MYQFVIVEDNPTSSKKMKSFLEQHARANHYEIKVTVYSDAESFLENACSMYDLVFLDIQLPGKNGMETARIVRERGLSFLIIFVTNLAQFAVNGYEVDALDFIIKPVSQPQLSMKLQKALRRLAQDRSATIAVTVDRSVRFLSSQDIIYVEILNHDLLFHTVKQTCRTRGILSDMERKLKDSHLIRISSCYLINMKYVSELTAHSLIMTTGEELAVSRTRKKDVLNALTAYIGGGI